jgi:hypothetical protein
MNIVSPGVDGEILRNASPVADVNVVTCINESWFGIQQHTSALFSGEPPLSVTVTVHTPGLL